MSELVLILTFPAMLRKRFFETVKDNSYTFSKGFSKTWECLYPWIQIVRVANEVRPKHVGL